MSLADKAQAGPPRKGRVCRACLLLDTLPDGESAALRRMLARDSAWSASKLYAALKDEGVPGLPESDQFIGVHRRKCL